MSKNTVRTSKAALLIILFLGLVACSTNTSTMTSLGSAPLAKPEENFISVTPEQAPIIKRTESITGITSYTEADTAETKAQDIAKYNDAGDLWSVLGSQFDLGNNEDESLVQDQIDLLLRNKDTLTEMATRAQPYLYYIYQQVKERHLPIELVLLPMIESGYNPRACSSVGACGLWQFMPGTASGLSVRQNWWFDGRRDIVQSTNAALNYLVELNREFNGNWMLAIAAYDTGPGSVDKAMKENAREGKGTDFWDLDLSEETRDYVPKLLALAAIIAHPNRYGVTLPPVKDAPYLARVSVSDQVPLPTAAKFTDLSLGQFNNLNPAFNRFATPPGRRTHLLIPVTDVLTFEDNMTKFSEQKPVQWEHYTPRHGDTLTSIAEKFHTSEDLIKNLNNLSNNVVSSNTPLIIAKNTDSLPSDLVTTVHEYMAVKNNLPGPKMDIHEVRSGETLWSIAKKYGTKIADLRYWNHIQPGAEVAPNTNLIIWKNTRSQGSVVTDHNYIVRRGDSLSSVASRYNVSVDAIKNANHLHDDTIALGERLVIPTVNKPAPGQYEVKLGPAKVIHYTVQRGDYLYKIAKKNDVSVQNLIDWNHIGNDQTLHTGQVLDIHTKA